MEATVRKTDKLTPKHRREAARVAALIMANRIAKQKRGTPGFGARILRALTNITRVEARDECATCGATLLYSRDEAQGGTVKRYCSKTCRSMRHNASRLPR